MSDQIAVETNATGTVGARYILDAYRQPVGQDQGSNRSWYVTDNRGNLTQLLDSDLSGTSDVRAVFGYDPYGKPKAQLTKGTPVWDSRLRFQMAPLDPTTGNYNLGPRLMNPNINRFVGADFYAGSSANVALQLDPLTGNRYLYAGASPAGLIDDGHRCQERTRMNSFGSVAAVMDIKKKCPPTAPLEFPKEVIEPLVSRTETIDAIVTGSTIETILERDNDPLGGYIITVEDPTLASPSYIASDVGNIFEPRPRFRKGTVDENWARATPGTTGRLCPTCGKEMFVEPGSGPRDWDIDHQPPWSTRIGPMSEDPNLTRQDVIDEFQKGTRLIAGPSVD